MDKKIYQTTILLILTIMCNACNEQRPETDFFECVEVISEYSSIYSDKGNLSGPVVNIEIVDSILITEHAMDEYNFSFFNGKNGQRINRWGRIGQGPNEYIQIASGFTVSNSYLIFLDNAKKEINYAPLSELITENDTLNIKREKYPYSTDFRPLRISVVNNIKVAVGMFKERFVVALDSNNNQIDSDSDYPFEYKEVTGIDRGVLFQSKIKSNEKQKKCVALILSSDIFEIYDVSGSSLHRTYQHQYNHVPQIKKKGERYLIDNDKSIKGLSNLAVTDELICFTYSPLTCSEARKASKESNEILCFNWEGKKVKKYILPIAIKNFCLDEKYIYGTKEYAEENVIYRFKR